ncbi:MAG: histidyl-tRNA synthetase [Candidatus Magnetoglobus multicellularis str. Araruama]|uniref:Histidyl-tRNA synthetase n=1 Tax=Candidatus Magnetoglobus multicellularis str. Araruama TaxID=890399 RepID=A0A1V1PIL8_9BACT|nr:MAG: histidyl-tRNA synthetase [Candidatus Magnetoglobus multicellularis str. Araruama]
MPYSITGEPMKKNTRSNDLSIQDVSLFRSIENTFLKRCRQFGYKEVKTGTIQPLHIYTALGTLSSNRLRRMYSFLDWDGWSGERVVLKPDSSPSIVRFYAENLFDHHQKQKLFYVENHFEWSDTGENISERWQCGLENIGDASVISDVEAIFIAQDILDELGFNNRHIFLSYPAIIRHLVQTLVFSKDKQLQLLDDIKKQRFDQVKSMLSGVDKGSILINLLEIKGNTVNYLKNVFQLLHSPEFKTITQDMERLLVVSDHLDRMQCSYTLDFSLIGNLDYYTGIQFQIFSEGSRKSNADILCAGGRYDQLALEMFRLLNIQNSTNLPTNIPAVGFALYAKNVIRQLLISKQKQEEPPHILIYISQLASESISIGQLLSDILADMGFSSTLTFNPIEQDTYSQYGAVIEVDHERFQSGYQFLHEQSINKYILNSILGDNHG